MCQIGAGVPAGKTVEDIRPPTAYHLRVTMKRPKPRSDFGRTARVLARAALGLRLPRLVKGRPGAAPGIEHHELAKLPSQPGGVKVTVVDYAVGRVESSVVEDVAAVSDPAPGVP